MTDSERSSLALFGIVPVLYYGWNAVVDPFPKKLLESIYLSVIDEESRLKVKLLSLTLGRTGRKVFYHSPTLLCVIPSFFADVVIFRCARGRRELVSWRRQLGRYPSYRFGATRRFEYCRRLNCIALRFRLCSVSEESFCLDCSIVALRPRSAIAEKLSMYLSN